jgi:hypothetical protein
LKEHADDYHRPPANVPRDEMWETIVRARQARSTPVAGHIGSRSPLRYAVAASLLIGAGIGLGYWMRGPATTPQAGVAVGVTVSDSTVRNTVYEVASVRHLTAVESMLTSFRDDRRSESDSVLHRLARDLLATTRLLMDSPAAEEASRRQLLEDLEYVLVQIVQLDPNAPAADRALVDRAITREQVLTRIRSSSPAGLSSGT